ncbi:MAG: TRAM domain-containing protein, partial [Ilumatobacter sp.]|nr:TRAM domain-containing protein [Ilumatobacter sp.]
MNLTVRPDRLVAGGDAMARDVDGRVVFVRGALPGEEVEVTIESEKKDFARGTVGEVLAASPDRIEPQCYHRRAGCGGCGWMHIEPLAQLEAKTEIVRESLRRIGRLDPERVDGLVAMGNAVNPFRYRTTIRVVGGPDGGLGFREEGTNK